MVRLGVSEGYLHKRVSGLSCKRVGGGGLLVGVWWVVVGC